MSNHTSLKVFVVNLEKDTNKKEYMLNHLEQFDFDPVFIEAIYGRDLSEVEIKDSGYRDESAQEKIGRSLGRGEIGCFLSHVSIFRKIVDEGVKHALILEDDIVLDQGINDLLTAIINSKCPWQIVLLGHHSRFSRNQMTPASIWGKCKLSELSTLVRPCDLAMGTYGYLINIDGARKMLEATKIINSPIDQITGNNEFTNLYMINPPPIGIHQHLSDSFHSMNDRGENIRLKEKNARSKAEIIKNMPAIKQMIQFKDILRDSYYKFRPVRRYKISG